ncbi:hypothetical protein [Profundibacterium mesophilum]|uniref:Uncharacterized protein n=1 Tax=Profundibacterium mesophilum KAUST100406-0324 TaxID=1037889 RepID=A0A921TB82_9RHOB|nr:hypothetical protein [Profundibacterium mesophilum]KAF0675060.1 hypothetical protein PMES_02581 [Profundibacterium mesophilum KAUST100406-0324]
MLDGINNETLILVGSLVGSVIGGVYLAIKGARSAPPMPSAKDKEQINEGLFDVQGGLRQLRQELRIEAKEARKVTITEHRETRLAIDGLREVINRMRDESRDRDDQ